MTQSTAPKPSNEQRSAERFEDVFGFPSLTLAKAQAHDSKGQASASSNAPAIRRIAHLDMDAFYASVELLRYPQLKGLPVVIGGGRKHLPDTRHLPEGAPHDPDLWDANTPVSHFPRIEHYEGRGVITTATYAARAFGVGSAMGLMKAAKLCPQAILLPVDFDQYRHYSRTFKDIITEICPDMEDRGVDEVYLDFTHTPGGQREGGRVLARLIQKTIQEQTGLTCSIGVAPNKLLAKMCSEFDKPLGITVLFESEIESRILPLPCQKINGIGPKASLRLKELNINTIGELAQKPLDHLIEHFGKNYGAWLYHVARGMDDKPIERESEPVSMSRESTFSNDLDAVRDKEELGRIFDQLCEKVSLDLLRKGFKGKTVGLKIKFNDFKVITRDLTLEQAVSSATDIAKAARQSLKRVGFKRKIRLLGIRVGSLERIDAPNPNQPHRPPHQLDLDIPRQGV